MCKHRFRLTLAFTFLVVMAAGPAPAQDRYPSKPIRIIVGNAPGGPSDVLARMLGSRLEPLLGQPVITENRSGASGTVANTVVTRSPPDGYTIALQGASIGINVSLFPKINFDPLRDFAPVSMIGETTYLIAVPSTIPATTLGEFINLARANKGRFFYGAPSSPSVLATVMLSAMAGIDMVRIPYRGAALAIPGLLNGEIQFLISSIGPLMPLVEAKQVRALAITSERRTAIAPNIPTVIESGLPGYATTTWYGLFVPTGTPRPIIDRLNAAVHQVLAEPEVRARMVAQGFDITPSTPEALGDAVRAEIAKWKGTVKDAGLTEDAP